MHPRLLLVGAALAQLVGGVYWVAFDRLARPSYGWIVWIECLTALILSVPLAFGRRIAFWCSALHDLGQVGLAIWAAVWLAPGMEAKARAPEPLVVGGGLSLVALLLLTLGHGGLRLDTRGFPPR